MGAYWRHLANTTELSMCISNAALCQITFTTCFHYASNIDDDDGEEKEKEE